MKYFLYILFCLLPFSASATMKLADCDEQSYEVIIRNGAEQRVVTVTPKSGEIEEFSPMVTFQLKGKDKNGNPHPVISRTSPYEELCIWHGKIQIQRMNTGGNGANGGWSLR